VAQKNGVLPNGVVQKGGVPNGVVPNGVAPNVVVNNGVAPTGCSSTANFENLPAGDLLTWLQEHASEKYLQDRLQQLCKEVKKLQS
jgi:hypothetical protein